MKYLLTFCLLACTLACSRPQQSASIAKKWMMHTVVRNGTDVTERHIPNNERWIEFHTDSTFASGGRPFGENSGSYTLETRNDSLFLFIKSNAGDDDDSSWIVELSDSTMEWRGIENSFAQQFVLSYRAAK